MTDWIRGSSILVVALLLGAYVPVAASHDVSDHAAGTSIEPVISTSLLEVEGQHATAVVVTLEPGAHFEPHRHPGTVLVYVLDGEVESALDDEAPTTFKAGEAWTEYAGALHRVTRNAGDQPSRILAVLLHGKDAPLQLPAD